MPINDTDYSLMKIVEPKEPQVNKKPIRVKSLWRTIEQWAWFLRPAKEIFNDDIIACPYCGCRAKIYHPTLNGGEKTGESTPPHIEHCEDNPLCPGCDPSSARKRETPNRVKRTENSFWGFVFLPIDSNGEPADARGGIPLALLLQQQQQAIILQQQIQSIVAAVNSLPVATV